MKSKALHIISVFLFGFLIGCGGETFPKPKGMLRLKYPEPIYDTLASTCTYTFEKNKIVSVQKAKGNKKCWYNLNYPGLKATVYISYYPVKNNLDSLLRDAQNITQEHVVKADEITQEPYINKKKKVYGNLYKVLGDAASQSQFYITDSTRHFISGSVYFRVRPNYDSIQPAAEYLYKDVVHLMETIRWE